MRRSVVWLLISLPIQGVWFSASLEAIVVSSRVALDQGDNRFRYEYSVLQLALSKSEGKYGPWQLKPGPPMNLSRTLYVSKNNSLVNFIFKSSYSEEYKEHMIFAPLPIELGIVGYRVCFTSESNVQRIAGIKTLEKLKTLTIGQRELWLDNEILRYNGFKVIETSEFNNLFRMVAAGRFDLFCRGANEVLPEWEKFNYIEGLAIENSFVLAYKMPRVFWTHKSNVKLIERIHYGLEQAYEDGSLKELWNRYYEASVQFVDLQNRRIFWIENPRVKDYPREYEKYFYKIKD